jgi:hypothetical protein
MGLHGGGCHVVSQTLSFWWLGPGDLVYNGDRDRGHQVIEKAPPHGERTLVRTALITPERLAQLVREGKAAPR